MTGDPKDEANKLLLKRIARKLCKTIPEAKRDAAWLEFLDEYSHQRHELEPHGPDQFPLEIVERARPGELLCQWLNHPEYRK